MTNDTSELILSLLILKTQKSNCILPMMDNGGVLIFFQFSGIFNLKGVAAMLISALLALELDVSCSSVDVQLCREACMSRTIFYFSL